MTELTRQKIFQMASRRLRQEFEELGVIPHSGTKGSEAERLMRKFLNDHLPRRFAAVAGFIIDNNDKVSKQTDVIVYDALNCPAYRASDEAAILPNDNVAAVIEVKSVLDKERLKEAVDNIRATKSLAKTKINDGPFLVTIETLGCLFAFHSSLTLETIAQHYNELLANQPIGSQLDIIAVLDRGTIMFSAKLPNSPHWNPIVLYGLGGEAAEGAHLALGVQNLGDDTLDAFLRLLIGHLASFRNSVDPSGRLWRFPGGKQLVALTYLRSITTERDPILRDEKLKRYAADAAREFASYATKEDCGRNEP